MLSGGTAPVIGEKIKHEIIPLKDGNREAIVLTPEELKAYASDSGQPLGSINHDGGKNFPAGFRLPSNEDMDKMLAKMNEPGSDFARITERMPNMNKFSLLTYDRPKGEKSDESDESKKIPPKISRVQVHKNGDKWEIAPFDSEEEAKKGGKDRFRGGESEKYPDLVFLIKESGNK